MSRVTLQSALEQIEHSTLTERSKGLTELQHVFRHNRNNPKVETLRDESFTRIIVKLAELATAEQSTYARTKTPTTRTAAANRLSAIGSTYRVVIEASISALKLTTARNVLSHLSQTICMPTGEFCHPIALDYAKCFRAVLAHQPHLTHLPADEWAQLLQFSIDCMKLAEQDDPEVGRLSGVEKTASAATMTLSYRSSRSGVKESASSQNNGPSAKQIAEEMITCVQLLTAPPNAPVKLMFSSLLWTLIDSIRSASTSLLTSFRAINNVILRTRTEDTRLTRQVTPRLVRLITHFWSPKEVSWRDEMLITLILLRPYITELISQGQAWTFRSELTDLLKAISAEYSRRMLRDYMSLDDIRLETRWGETDGMISTPLYSLRCGRSEQRWFIVDTLAFLIDCLMGDNDVDDISDQESEDGHDGDLNERPRKRRRTIDAFDELVFRSTSDEGSGQGKLCNFQILTFLAQQRTLSAKQLAQAVERVTAFMSETVTPASSWALLALASCASQITAANPILVNKWNSAWQLATRSLNNPSLCRVASYALYILLKLRLVSQANISELVNTITHSMDLSGPTLLTDSVAVLLGTILKGTTHSNSASLSTLADNIVRWWARTYVPSRYDDRIMASSSAAYEVSDIHSLISTCLNRPSSISFNVPFPLWDKVASLQLHCNDQQELISYLLLRPNRPSGINTDLFEDTKSYSGSGRTSCEVLVLTHMTSELAHINDIWSRSSKNGFKSISTDSLICLSKACCFMASLAYETGFRDSKRQAQLQRQVKVLAKYLHDYAFSPSCELAERDAFLFTISTMFSSWREKDGHDAIRPSGSERLLCRAIYGTVSPTQNTKDSYDEEDIMDIDESNDSQESRKGPAISASSRMANDFSTDFSNEALRANISCYACAILLIDVEVFSMVIEDEVDFEIEQPPAAMVDFILSQPEFTILSSRKVIAALPKLGCAFDAVDAEKLLDFLMDSILGSYTYNRSEVAIGTIVDVMSSLTSVWSDPSNTKLFDLGVEIYEWFTLTALPNDMISPNVQKKLAVMLLQLCHVNTDYANGSNAPSVRTTLFGLLQTTNVVLHYHLAGKISSLFNLFVLSTHSAMFNDLQSSLPTDPEWVEGIAMRLVFLAKLASAWHSLLRQCVYYIFEAAGRVKASLGHAKRCIQELAGSLPLKSPQKLFTLFAPQLLHTWLESQQLSDLPYEAFQYQSIFELVHVNQREICAQLVMRGSEDSLDTVSKILNEPIKEIVRLSFAKSIAYAISRDVSSTLNPSTVETRLRTLVGTREDFKRYLSEQFATVLGQFFLSVHLEDWKDVWLEKRTSYGAAYKALEEMKRYSHSERKLPDAQEPAFRSKYLCDQIERLCRRLSLDSTKPWDTSTFTLAVRMLLDAMDDSLGSLHACLMIRRLRILVAMGGNIALEGFPIEMLILSLRSFVNDAVCADDVMGLLHYLFNNGQEYLVSTLGFLVGTVIILILQMRKHAKTRQDSTTQESQHQATVQRMIDFQSWLVKYLSTLTREHPSTAHSVLINALENLKLPGNARHGSPESELLVFLLDQWCADQPLCSKSDCLEAFQLLSESFEIPKSLTEDCLASDDDASKYATPLWDVLQASTMSQSFTVWAAQVLGRAYASTGLRPIESTITKPGDNPKHQDVRLGGKVKSLTFNSQKTIANKLCEILYSRNRIEAGLAEFSLRRISDSFKESEEALDFESMLPPTIASVVQEGEIGYQPASTDGYLGASVDIAAVRKALEASGSEPLNDWTMNLTFTICRWAATVPVVSALCVILRSIDGLAQEFLPLIIHILLASETSKEVVLRDELSKAATRYLTETNTNFIPIQQLILKVILYLQSQPIAEEKAKADRLRWLDVDLLVAASAAARCSMPACALLLAESNMQTSSTNRRTSRASQSQLVPVAVPDELLVSIFRQLEEPDSFYGIQQPASLQSVLERLDHESDGFGSLMFRSARMDSQMRLSHGLASEDIGGLTHSLSILNLDSLSFALLSNGLGTNSSTSADIISSARALQQWDLPLPETASGKDTAVFSILQEFSRATELERLRLSLHNAIFRHVEQQQEDVSTDGKKNPPMAWFGTLASLTEIGEIVSCENDADLKSMSKNLRARQSWMHLADYEQVLPILSNRHTFLGVLGQNEHAQKAMHLKQKQIRAAEVSCLLDGSRIAREHSRLQVALASVSSLTDMMEQLRQTDLNVEAAVKLETASVLWDSSQSEASIQMLRDILDIFQDRQQDIIVGEPGILAQLGHQLASARFERPEDILDNYLYPAVTRLKDRREGSEAGKVFFEFASFCDNELFNPGSIENLNRITKLHKRKAVEIDGYRSMIKSEKKSDQKKQLQRMLDKAKQWYEIDNAELERLKQSRDIYLQQSLRSYLLALQASDDHDICVLRFFALWLENADESAANKIVSKYLVRVPSWKFVVLMNQLMSRLENDESTFQGTLKAMIVRLCLDHPYHSMHHLFAAHRKPINTDDSSATSRAVAAQDIVYSLRTGRRGNLLNSMFIADRAYDTLAQAPPEVRENTNKIAAKEFPKALKVYQSIPPLNIPPATISLSLRPDCDYEDVPIITKFGSEVTILGGLSAPKLLSVCASNGQQYRQIFKSGNDDLRQDAIMEQVFEEVSKMLQNHKATRQRDLKIRTYKVIPLSSNSGIIEFVPNSLPLGDFLRPTHHRYHPQDYRDSKARDMIRAAASHSPETRLSTYRKVRDHMQPVLRHFFFERFHDPDEWFARRTAYTRTTASVSMLGHVLGLGDRHCQNILLDERTGEVVHIDLGVAFEAGRVLPIPELVPFRLTRDIVDGMGATGTEGVFRRCCEFTVDALRGDKGRIMTLLNVLRYDPLYTWTVSALRAKRLQDAYDAERNGDNNKNNNAAAVAAAAAEAAAVAAENAGAEPPLSKKKGEEEAGEADRALSIVEKKLSTTLSTAATVNELIQQATDERHLAMLFGGWAAYF